MKKFEYYQPDSLKEAYQIKDSLNGRVHYVAGGTDLFINIHKNMIESDALISLKGIKSLCGISFKDNLTIGSMTLLRDIERNNQIHQTYPALSQAVWWLANPQIRNVATIGGNLANSAPSADCAPPLLVLGAKLTIEGPNSKRKIPIEEFFTGPGENCLNETEVLTQIEIPEIMPKAGMSFVKIGRTVRDLAVSNVAALIVMEKKTCGKVRLAAGAVAPTPIRLRSVEEMMTGERITPKLLDQVKKKAQQEVRPISDVRSSAEYRREVTGVLVRRAIEQVMQNIN
jgi:carbon-monoxide dehydrogenase medium subunit